MCDNLLQEGAQVSFNIGRNQNTGIIKEVVTEEKQIGDQIVHASEENPHYIIEHSKTGSDINLSAGQVSESQGQDQGQQGGQSNKGNQQGNQGNKGSQGKTGQNDDQSGQA